MLAQLECPRGQAQVLFYLVLVLVLHSATQVEVSQVAGVAPSQQHLEVQQAMVASGVASWLLHHQRHPAEDGLSCFQTIRFKMD